MNCLAKIFVARARRILPASLPLLLSAIACSAYAQTSDPCKTQSNTVEINQCARQTLETKDRELNEMYKHLLNSLVSQAKEAQVEYAEVRKMLQEAQRSWVKFRDADCNAKLSLWEQGSIRGAIYLGCLIERTEQRINELRTWSAG